MLTYKYLFLSLLLLIFILVNGLILFNKVFYLIIKFVYWEIIFGRSGYLRWI